MCQRRELHGQGPRIGKVGAPDSAWPGVGSRHVVAGCGYTEGGVEGRQDAAAETKKVVCFYTKWLHKSVGPKLLHNIVTQRFCCALLHNSGWILQVSVLEL